MTLPTFDKTLTLLSSRSNRRNTALAPFMEHPEDVAFYTLTPQDVTLSSFLKNLHAELRGIYAGFGNQTASLLSKRDLQAEDLGRSLVADLSRVSPSLNYLILDQFDYLTLDESAYYFFQSLLEQTSLKVIINSRQLPRKFWSTFINDGKAAVYQDSFSPGALPEIEIFGFSHGVVLVDGVPITDWEGPLVRNLFYYLVDHPQVTRDEIFDSFWSMLSAKEATNVYHVTKRKISERLGFELTAYVNGFYYHSKRMLFNYDVASFETLMEKADQVSSEEAFPFWVQAAKLYRIPFLTGLDMPWIVRRREELKAKYAEALMGIARYHKAQGAVEQAIPFYLRAGREYPEREDLCRDVMELFRNQGQPQKSAEYYKSLERKLAESLGIQPSPTTQQLYQEIISGSAAKRSRASR